MTPLLVGLAGGSASGKSSVVEAIRRELGEDISCIALDAYYQSYDELSFQEKLEVNYDHPAAFDVDLLSADLKKLKVGERVQIPIYDYVAYLRKPDTRLVEPKPVVLVEGLFTLYYPQLRDLFDLKLFVDADSDERLIRRIRRDLSERGRSVESVLQQYQKQVKPMHEQFIEPTKKFADIILPEGASNEKGIRLVINHLKSALDGEK